MTAALDRTLALLNQPPTPPVPGQLAVSPPGLRIGSVCSGYRGLDMAVEQVFGGTTAWVSDIDPGANRILAHHWPDVPNLGDLKTVDWSAVEPVDIFCGGYPCQPFSSAGKRKGTDDERHIWPWIARALGVLRPRLAIFENVAGHLRLGFDTVLADLAALGFDAEWCVVRADEVGAAHQRKRLFLLAWSADAEGQGREGQGVPGRPALSGGAASDPDRVGGDGDWAHGGRRDEPAARHLAAAHTTGLGEREPSDEAHPITDRGEARKVSSSRGVRAAADTHGGGLAAHGELPAGRNSVRNRERDDADGRDTAAADPARDGRQQGRPEPARLKGRSDASLSSAPNWGGYGPAIARWEHVLGRPAPSPTNDLGRLNPPFVEWLMGLLAGHVTDVPGLSRTAQLKALGNGVVHQQAEAALRLLAARAGIPTVAA